MTRQVTDQLYIELDYFTPEEYYVYIGNAASAQSSSATQTTDISVIKTSAVAISSISTLTATISHIEGADLVAFAEANISAVAERIREIDSNISSIASTTTNADKFAGADSSLSSSFSITADLTEVVGQVVEANGSWSSAFTQTTAFDRTREDSSNQNSSFTQTATPTKIMQLDIAVSSAFTPVMTVEAIRNSFAVLDAVVSIDVDAVANRAANITIESIVNQSLTGDRTRDYASSQSAEFTQSSQAVKTASAYSAQSSAFTLTASIEAIEQGASIQAGTFTLAASVNRPTRNTTYTITSAPRYTPIVIDTSNKKWGSGSLHSQGSASSTIAPTSNIVWDGSNFKLFSAGYTWTSSDGLTWSRATNNLTENPGDIDYVNGYYSFNQYYSSNGTTWFSDAPAYRKIYVSGYYYYSFGDSTRLYVRRSTTINGTYSNVYNTANAGYSVGAFGVTSNGTNIVFGHVNQNTGAGVVLYSSNGTTWTLNTTVNSSNDFTQFEIEFGNSVYVAYFTNGLIRKSTNLTSWSTVSSPVVSTIDYARYRNNNWIVIDRNAIYSGSDIDSLIQRYQFNSNDLVFGIEYGSSKYVAYQKESALYSSNLTSWSLNEVENIENVKGFIDYSRGDNSDYASWGTIDFWLDNNGNTNGFILNQMSSTTYASNFSVGKSANQIYFSNGDTVYLSSSSLSSGWHHIRVTRSSNTVSLYVDGNRVATSNAYSPATSTNPIRLFGRNAADIRIDELLITDDVLTSPGSTTYTVPTGEFTNTANTDLLLHFNGNFEDDSDLPKTQIGAATLTSAFTQTASVERSLRDYSSNQSSAFTQTVSGNVLKDVSSSANSAFTVNSIIGVIKQADSAQSSNFTQTISADRVRYAQSNNLAEFTQISTINAVFENASTQSSEFTQSATVLRIQEGAANFDAVASQLAAVAKIGDFLIACDVIASQSTVAVKTTDVTSTQSSAFTQTAAGIKAVENSATLVAEVTESVTGRRLAGLVSAQSSAFTQTANVNYTAENISSQNANTALSADAAGSTVGFASAMSAEFAQSTVVDRIRSGASAQSSAFTQVTDVMYIRGVNSNQTATSTLSATSTRIQQGSAVFNTVASQLIAAAKIGDFLVACDVVASQTAVVNVTASANSTQFSTFTQTADANAQFSANSTQSSTFTQTAVGIKAVEANAALTSTFTQTVDAVKNTDAISIEVGTFTQTTGAVKTASGNSALEAFAFELSVGSRTRNVSANLVATSSVIAQPTKVVSGSVTINSAMTFVAGIRVIHITEALTYKIPRENFTYKIQRENREFTIREEDRTYKIRRG